MKNQSVWMIGQAFKHRKEWKKPTEEQNAGKALSSIRAYREHMFEFKKIQTELSQTGGNEDEMISFDLGNIRDNLKEMHKEQRDIIKEAKFTLKRFEKKNRR
jgi:hypothetical protein